ncbi:MAG: biotin/lipoyl-binding protein [Bacteroidota bacterium]|nr:biotin/lipoyl-binding protein [Bacteroidota bacterium]
MSLPANIVVEIEGKRFDIPGAIAESLHYNTLTENHFEITRQGKKYTIQLLEFDLIHRTCILEINGQAKTALIIRDLDVMIEKMGLNTSQSKKHRYMMAPMPGLVKSINVTEGQQVTKGDPLLILEAMKMENVIGAPHDAVIKKIQVEKGQAVERGLALIEFSPLTTT